MTQGYYSRDAAVTAIRSFYQFFATLPSLAPEYIWEPPSGGWPEVNGTTLSRLSRNRDVVDLLRHIPYINDTQIAFHTTVIDYTADVKWSFDRSGAQGNVLPCGAGVLPEHVAVLTDGGKYGSWLLLDTQEGTITDFKSMETPESIFPPPGHPEHWRAYRTLPIRDFFESWKEKYRSLAWVVMPDEDDGVLCNQEPSSNEIREIYRAHGWPSFFRREDCKEALLKWRYKKLCAESGTRRRHQKH
ncbi:uncharacterized protein LY89DRAFT_725139 [Mollisia scopiformis]|uniref:Uncharacterized protein n=1 Tax=Mollisia scopiformis TaxID=149040 RepID=A0A132B726_MOLSC|nr:uncharacterized protein LY89DRAFT_725139 [Mollisia scopiformis]KUJ08210.1 hypothetical protein LY89DRAFT_725139 [Mollisia scopiformis]